MLYQTIGFEHIQIILVINGSTDDSEMNCLKYKKLYNNNIIYVKKGHSGFSKVRNIGLDYAQGKNINFLILMINGINKYLYMLIYSLNFIKI